MTDDLEGRLDPESLKEEPSIVNDKGPEEFYTKNDLVFPVETPSTPPSPKASMGVVFVNQEAIVLDGHLSALSFGNDGWLCTISFEGNDKVSLVALKAAQVGLSYVRVVLDDGTLEMHTNVDCTATFSSYGSTSFTATSDEARYV